MDINVDENRARDGQAFQGKAPFLSGLPRCIYSQDGPLTSRDEGPRSCEIEVPILPEGIYQHGSSLCSYESARGKHFETTCPKVFGNRNLLRKHQAWHSTMTNFICEECGKALINKQSLNNHMKIHAAERKHKCSYCPKAFVTKDNCIRHERIHTGEKPYVCEVCGRDFNQNVSLKQLMKKHHNETIPEAPPRLDRV